MRKKNSIRNSLISLFSNVISLVFNFISQAIFIRLLGEEYLGLNGLFTNILTMLSFFELGIGSAIVYNLYKPIAEDDKKKIIILMQFYKKSYTCISIIVFAFGLIFLPFLNHIVGSIEANVNIHVVYIMFLFSTSSSYMLSYKKNIIQAYQKGFINDLIHIFYVIILNVFQLVFLIIFKNYYIFLGIKIICQIIENLIASICANTMYPFIKNKVSESLDKVTKDDIVKKVKALFFHKIGNSVVNGTDNIIISYFFGVSLVGIYSSYNLIINSVNNLFRQMLLSVTPSVGNMLIDEKNYEKRFDIFSKIRFINFVISCVTSVCILCIITPFIRIWIGDNYVLDLSVTVVLVINYFQKMQRIAYNAFKDAAGIWYEDRYIPLVESFLNIILSVLFLKLVGLSGVFLGTIASGMALWCYSYPKYVYKNLFNRNYSNYIKETFGYFILFIIVSLISFAICSVMPISNILLKIIFNLLVSCIIPSILLIVIFHKTDKFIYFYSMCKKIFFSRFKKNNGCVVKND